MPRLLPKTAGNHKLQGRLRFQGLPIAIENRPGSVRSGTDYDGTPWRTKMKLPYGYIQGTEGADGDPVDVYVGKEHDAPFAYVVHQKNPETHKYDEDKIFLGVGTKAEAKRSFLEHYDDPEFLGPIERMPLDVLKAKLVEQRGRKITSKEASYHQCFTDGGRRDTKLPGYLRDASAVNKHAERCVPIELFRSGKFGEVLAETSPQEAPTNSSGSNTKVAGDVRYAGSTFSHRDSDLQVPFDGTAVDPSMVSSRGHDSSSMRKQAMRQAFLEHYDSKEFLGPIAQVAMDRLQDLVDSKRRLVKISHPVNGFLAEFRRLINAVQK